MGNSTTIFLTILAGTVAMAGLSAAILLFVVAYKRRLREKEDEYKMMVLEKEMEVLTAVMDAQEEERDKIARNLHDEIGPLAALIKIRLSARQATEALQLKEEMDLADMLADNIRSVSHDLAPQLLKSNGLSDALQFYIKSLNGIEVNFRSELDRDHPIQSGKKSINIYRIALEVLRNAVKYDSPSKLTLRLSADKENFILNFMHNGVGISNQDFAELAGKKGLGLESIKARTILLKGTIDYHQGPPASVTLTIPVHE